MSKFNEVREIVANYQKTADNLFARYDEQVSKLRDKYRPEAFAVEVQTKIWPHYFGTLQAEREDAKKKIEDVFTGILGDLKKSTMRPIKPETLEILRCINDFGIKITHAEAQMLKEAVAGNLFGGKVLAQVAEKSGWHINVPNADEYVRALQEAKSVSLTAIDAYSGPKALNFPGADLLDVDRTGTEVPVWQKLLASNYLADNKTLDYAEKLFTQGDVDIDLSISQDEKQRLEKSLDDANKITDEKEKQKRIKKIFEAEPDIINKMNYLGDSYRSMIAKYVDVGSFR